MLRKNILTLILFVMITSVSSAQAAEFALIGRNWFQTDFIDHSARSLAMASSDISTARDPGAHVRNAAPLPSGNTAQIAYSNSKWYYQMDVRNCSLALEYKGLRFGYSRSELYSDDMPVRTAFNPEGTGQTFKISQRSHVSGLSYNVGQIVAPDNQDLLWIVGINHRLYKGDAFGPQENYWNLDGGMTVAVRKKTGDSWFGFYGSLTARNFLNRELTTSMSSYDPLQSYLAGLSIRSHTDLGDTGFRSLDFSISLMWLNNDGNKEYYHKNELNMGSEIVVGDILAVRLGYKGVKIEGNEITFGGGVRTPATWSEKYGATIDYGHSENYFLEVNQWSVSFWSNW